MPNPLNRGAYAVAKTKSNNLKYSSQIHEEWIEGFNRQITSPDFYSHTELKPPKFKEYDHSNQNKLSK